MQGLCRILCLSAEQIIACKETQGRSHHHKKGLGKNQSHKKSDSHTKQHKSAHTAHILFLLKSLPYSICPWCRKNPWQKSLQGFKGSFSFYALIFLGFAGSVLLLFISGSFLCSGTGENLFTFLSLCKLIEEIRHHIQYLSKAVLISDIHQLSHAV